MHSRIEQVKNDDAHKEEYTDSQEKDRKKSKTDARTEWRKSGRIGVDAIVGILPVARSRLLYILYLYIFYVMLGTKSIYFLAGWDFETNVPIKTLGVFDCKLTEKLCRLTLSRESSGMK